MPDIEKQACPLPLDDEPAPFVQLQVLRHHAESEESGVLADDLVAEEYPVALVFNGISHAVMMASPINLKEFAVGFTLSEGIAGSHKEIHDVEVTCYPDGAEVQLTIAQSAFVKLKEHRRTLTGRTGCGVCGTESLRLLDLAPERVTAPAPQIAEGAIQRILAELPNNQPLTRATGCAHAAAWCSPDGTIHKVFEDVGRHNALDKLFGWLALSDIDTGTGFVFLTSRASYELIRKAARMNVGLVATISAPTALAIRIAHAAGIRLLSFCRKNGCVEYPLNLKSEP